MNSLVSIRLNLENLNYANICFSWWQISQFAPTMVSLTLNNKLIYSPKCAVIMVCDYFHLIMISIKSSVQGLFVCICLYAGRNSSPSCSSFYGCFALLASYTPMHLLCCSTIFSPSDWVCLLSFLFVIAPTRTSSFDIFSTHKIFNIFARTKFRRLSIFFPLYLGCFHLW